MSVYQVDVVELKKIMVEKNLEKIKDLSEATGISRNTLSRILSQKITPSAQVMYALASALKMTDVTAGRIFFHSALHFA